MLILYDFKCDSCGRIAESLVSRDVDEIDCWHCKGTAHRIISPIQFNLEGVSGDFPTAADKWARQHEQAGKANSK